MVPYASSLIDYFQNFWQISKVMPTDNQFKAKVLL